MPTAMLYRRVLEHVNLSVGEMMIILQRLIGGQNKKANRVELEKKA